VTNRSLKIWMAAGLPALIAACGIAAAAKAPRYHVIARYVVGGTDKGYDYLRLDAPSHRLFVSHSTRVEVLDADSGKKVGEIADTPGVHGIAFAPEFHHGFTSNGQGRSVTMFDLDTLQTLSIIKYTGAKPDSIDYDPESRHLFVVNGSDTGDITVIAPDTGAIIATIPLGANKLEELQLDGHGRAFVNDEGQNTIHVFDTHKLTKLATWPIAPGEEATGLAFDPQTHRLFAACGNNKLVVLDSDTGKVVGSADIGPDPDGAVFDPKTKRVLTSNHDGTLSVVQTAAGDQYKTVQTAKTEPFARTIAFDERNGRVYLPTAQFGPAPQPSEKDPKPRAPMLPETFVVLVVGE
jgi:DNA-binding beta-propeller fold protein YncE